MLHRIRVTNVGRVIYLQKGKPERKNSARRFVGALSFVLALLILASCVRATPPSAAIPHPTLTPTTTSTSTPLPTSTSTLLPTPVGGGTGKVIFEYFRVGYEKDFPELGGESQIFMANLDGTDLTPITRGLMTYNTLADVSPDGQKALVISWPDMYTAANSTSAVYVIDLDDLEREPLKLASGIMYTPNKTAIWLDNSRVVLVDKEDESWGVFLMNSDGTGRTKLSRDVAGVQHYNLRVSADAKWIFWNGFGFEGGQYHDGGIWRGSVDGTELSLLENSEGIPMDGISPDRSQVVWQGKDSFAFINMASVLDLSHPIHLDAEKSANLDSGQLLWAPNSKQVLINRGTCTGYGTDTIWPGVTMLHSVQEPAFRELQIPSKYANLSISFLDWSPDSQNILLRASAINTIFRCQMNLIGGQLEILHLDSLTFSEILTQGVSHDAVGDISWIP